VSLVNNWKKDFIGKNSQCKAQSLVCLRNHEKARVVEVRQTRGAKEEAGRQT
jgi:hypothetical protein